MGRVRKTIQKFIEESENIHGKKYSYIKSIYKTSHVKLDIECKKHGMFKMSPANHLSGQGCIYCSGAKFFREDTSSIINDDGSKIIHLGKKEYCTVDEEDYERLINHTWWVVNGYAITEIKGKTILMHRYIMNETNPKIYIDHQDRNRLDNRKSNLRRCTPRQNSMNSVSAKNSLSRYKGVSRASKNSDQSKWRARIMINGKEKSLGVFDTEISAAMAYDEKALKHFGEFAYFNFPEIKNK